MATKAEVNAVYAAGLIQGITLVTFPPDPPPRPPPLQQSRDRVVYRGAELA
jgi:hypothetical protein